MPSSSTAIGVIAVPAKALKNLDVKTIQIVNQAAHTVFVWLFVKNDAPFNPKVYSLKLLVFPGEKQKMVLGVTQGTVFVTKTEAKNTPVYYRKNVPQITNGEVVRVGKTQ